jgi:hypothetical protein
METPGRRALAPLDANKMSPAPGRLASSSPSKAPLQAALGDVRKRTLESGENVIPKRTRVEAKAMTGGGLGVVGEAKEEKGRDRQQVRLFSSSSSSSTTPPPQMDVANELHRLDSQRRICLAGRVLGFRYLGVRHAE